MCRSLAERRHLAAHRSEVLNLGKEVQSQRWFCRQTLMALNFMRAAIGSQCKLMTRGVTCILFGSLRLTLQRHFGL